MVEPDPAPDFDEEQYQNELNDAVDDGGGCAETWETLSEARDKFTPDRRSVLKGSRCVRSLCGWCQQSRGCYCEREAGQ